MRRSVRVLYAAALVVCAAIAFQNRGAEQFDEAARLTRHFDSRRGRVHHITREQLAQIPPSPRRIIHGICFMEGGDMFGAHDCYADAARELRDLGRGRRFRLWAAVIGGALVVLAFGLHAYLGRRSERQREALSGTRA